LVKGVTGVGLPLVLVPLTAQFVPVPVAVALVVVPQTVSNVGQALEGGDTLAAIRRLAPILVALVLGTLIGVHLLINIDRRLLSLILGLSFLALAGLLGLLRRLRISPVTARWMGPAVGFCAGIIGGLSAMFGPPMIAFLLGTGAPPNAFVKSMAIVAFTASLTLAVALAGSGTIAGTDWLVSAACLIPIQLGMPLGRWLRGRISPEVFRILVLVVLAASGLDMLRKALF
jgi:uncharacterized protein